MHIALFFFPLALQAAVVSSDRIEITEIVGPPKVTVVRAQKKEESVGKGTELFVGDEVRSVARQVISLRAYDGSQWKVAPDSSLKIEKRVPESKGLFYWVFGMVRGSLWGKVTPSEQKDLFRLKVHTKNASLGIRGTEYLMQSTEQGAEVDVLEGTVWWGSSDDFKAGSYIEVKAGEHSDFTTEAQKPVPTKLRGEELLQKYHLSSLEKSGAIVAASEKKTAADCRHQGLGWRDKGNGQGECFKAPPED